MSEKVEERIDTNFTEHFVEADGFRIRYLEAGRGEPVVALHGARGLTPSPFNQMLATAFRVIAFEIPGFGHSPVNQRSQSMRDLGHTVAVAASELGLDRYKLVSTAVSARIALWQAIDAPQRIDTMVLISPSAILPDNWSAPHGTPEENARRMYAHPETQPPSIDEDPEIAAQQRALVARVRGPNRDPELEGKFSEITATTLIVFGTKDGVIPPAMGHLYLERIPNSYYALVYDAGHAIAAERPQALHALVSDFLERREAFIVSRTNTRVNP